MVHTYTHVKDMVSFLIKSVKIPVNDLCRLPQSASQHSYQKIVSIFVRIANKKPDVPPIF